MIKGERFSSFEEMDEAQLRDNKAYASMLKKSKKPMIETPGQKGFRQFIELLRKNILHIPGKKK